MNITTQHENLHFCVENLVINVLPFYSSFVNTNSYLLVEHESYISSLNNKEVWWRLTTVRTDEWSLTVILYGVFCSIIRKKVRELGFQESQNRSRNQVFIQSTMMCGFNFFVASSYTLFIFLGEYVILLQSCFFIYQFTTGLQALIYLLCNQTILDGVKEDLFGFFGFI